eukprot:m.355320 g.355320  ORF g.355320 m.355320 type:complete len:503 (-) comp17220_c0_seq1:148-1656(-)
MASYKVTFDYQAENDDELSIAVGDIITNVVLVEEGWMEGDLNGKHGLFPDNFVEKMPETPKAVEPARPPAPKPSAPPAATKKTVKCTFEYAAEAEDELSLAVGDVVTITDDSDPDWWEGELNGKKGVFPSNFVEPCDAPAASKQGSESELIAAQKPQGVGFGNIFAGGAITLKKTNAKPKPAAAPAPTPAAAPPLKHVEPKKPAPPASTPTPTPAPAPAKPTCKVLHAYEPQEEDELKLTPGDIITIIEKEDDGWWRGECNGKTGVFPDNFVEEIKAGAPPKPASASLSVPDEPRTRTTSLSWKKREEAAKEAQESVAKPPPTRPSVARPPAPSTASRSGSVATRPPVPGSRTASVSKPPPPAAKKPPPLAAKKPPPPKKALQPPAQPAKAIPPKPAPAETPAAKPEPPKPAAVPKPTSTGSPPPTSTPSTPAPTASTPTPAGDFASKSELATLNDTVSALTATVEKLNKKVMLLMTDLDEEKAARLKMQVEVERLKKLSDI